MFTVLEFILAELLDCRQSKYGCCVDGDPKGPEADGKNKKRLRRLEKLYFLRWQGTGCYDEGLILETSSSALL